MALFAQALFGLDIVGASRRRPSDLLCALVDKFLVEEIVHLAKRNVRNVAPLLAIPIVPIVPVVRCYGDKAS
jgi:hypothetical protein